MMVLMIRNMMIIMMISEMIMMKLVVVGDRGLFGDGLGVVKEVFVIENI